MEVLMKHEARASEVVTIEQAILNERDVTTGYK